jgi:hypothetical protein
VAQQPLQRGLQQILGVGTLAGEGERDGHQPVAPLGEQPLKLPSSQVTLHVTPHHAIPLRYRLTLRPPVSPAKDEEAEPKVSRRTGERPSAAMPAAAAATTRLRLMRAKFPDLHAQRPDLH